MDGNQIVKKRDRVEHQKKKEKIEGPRKVEFSKYSEIVGKKEHIGTGRSNSTYHCSEEGEA